MGAKILSSSLIKEIEDTGFSCNMCGVCCKEVEPGSNIVMAGPAEIREIMKGTGLSFQDIVTPYPEMVRNSDSEYTIGWALRRSDDRCFFLKDNRCSIYQYRPWICRTYPFMLIDRELVVYPCQGTGKGKKTKEPERIAYDLYSRLEYEIYQEDRIRAVFKSHIIPTGRPVVIDEEGIKDYYG